MSDWKAAAQQLEVEVLERRDMSASCCCCHNAHDCKNAEIGRLRVRAEDIISVCMDPLLDDDEKVDQALAHARRALEGK